MAKKSVDQYVRGYEFGAKAAREVISAHGRILAEHNARSLELDARKRGRGAFDKGYARGYRSVVGAR